jgi:hypothetical protein
MATVNILVIVDVLAAVQQGLQSNVWMLDTGKYLGTQEAGNELITLLDAGDRVNWTVVAIDPGTNVAFATDTPAFTGAAVPANIDPKPVPLSQNQYTAVFEVPGGTQAGFKVQHSCTLSIDGHDYSFDPYLQLADSTMTRRHPAKRRHAIA